jgi:hypothetical protein
MDAAAIVRTCRRHSGKLPSAIPAKSPFGALEILAIAIHFGAEYRAERAASLGLPDPGDLVFYLPEPLFICRHAVLGGHCKGTTSPREGQERFAKARARQRLLQSAAPYFEAPPLREIVRLSFESRCCCQGIE